MPGIRTKARDERAPRVRLDPFFGGFKLLRSCAQAEGVGEWRLGVRLRGVAWLGLARLKGAAAAAGTPARGGAGGPEPGYRLRARDLGRIHRAASAGNVAQVQRLLLLGKSGPDDRDKRRRTALHLACAGGHKEVVTLLVERKCQLNLYDSENRTALMKAVQCQQEECATILLEHGADPNLQDFGGNTALHYAVSSQNRAIAAKLLAHDADIKISNEDDLTPVLLAVKEDKKEMADFLINESNRYALRKMQRFSSKPGIDDSRHISDDEFDFEAKERPIKPADEKDKNDIESVSQDHTKNTNLPCVDEALKKRSEMLSALGLEEEDIDSPTDSESISESLPQKYVDHLLATANQGEKSTLNGQVEDVFYIPSFMSGSSNFKKAKIDDPRNRDFPVAHLESLENYYHLEPSIEVKDSIPNKAVGIKDVQTAQPDLPPELDLDLVTEEDPERLDEHEYNHLQVSDSHDKEKDHMLQDEIVRLKLEVNTMKNQNQEKEKKYLEDIKILKERNEDLQRTVKRNEEIFTETVFQSSGRINVLAAENTMLKSQLEQAKQKNDTLETELETYRSRLATATQVHDQSQISKRELELSFQRARDEWSRLQEKMNLDVANLQDTNEVLSQQLSKMEAKLNNLEIELHQTRDSVTEKTLALECIQRDLSQTQGQKKEIEHMYQNEQGKVNKYMGKQESLEKRLSHLQSENMLPRQQLDDAHNIVDSKEKTMMKMYDQFQDNVQRLQAEREKHRLLLERINKELINDSNHLTETICQYESEKAEREVFVRQLQQELADSLKKQSMSEASLEDVSPYHTNLEDEKDLKRKIDDLTTKLDRASSKCQHLDAQNQVLQQELLFMKVMQKNNEKVKKNKKQLEQEVVNLKSHIELNMVECSQVEQFKQETEERARQDIVEKLKEVNLFLQVQAASQEQLRENTNTSLKSQMELRIKELESELSKMKSQEDCNKRELEKYKQLFLEEMTVRKSLQNKLKKSNERLAQIISTNLLVEKEQSRSVMSTLTGRPVLEPPSMGNLTNSARLPRNLAPRESILFPSAKPRPPDCSTETFLLQMQQQLDKSIKREIEEAAAELESGSYRSLPRSIEASNLTQDLLLKTSREYVEILKKQYLI
ncbi:ankyrin repeat domain-containing protein 26-like [Suncus etruscus]|uniref:ankyrin repeat domain-containing protein 26-like n=1 Tax=Suncus etruscus TaxID=109475 RepID=UPI00210F7EB9|nr:ankyrin repeat domain-containing protein 26-like [Suncus etruscus]